MTRVTLVAFALLTGFFYVTGKPADESGQGTNTFADLAKYKNITEHSLRLDRTKQLISSTNSSSSTANSSLESQSRKHASIKAPALPTRNPRRIKNGSAQYAKLTPSTVAVKPAKKIQLAKAEPTRTFQDGRNKFTGGTAKPLALSYQQRFVKSQKPVLGPRLTAVLIKRELRRVGCYKGNVTSKWDDSARAAVTFFNTSTGSNLAANKPVVSSLEQIQQITKTVCVDQPVIEGTIIASAGLPNAAPTALTIKKASRWRTSVQHKKAAYRRVTALRTSQLNTRRPRVAERYIAPPKQRVRPRRKARKYRIRKRSKRIRVAKRKARRRTAVRSWKRKYRRKRFGFSGHGGNLSLNN